MKLLAVIVIFAVVAIVGSRLTFTDRRLPMGFRNILFTGTEYIFLGIVLGKMGLEVLDENTLESLEPALLFALAWIGFLYGLQFEVRQLTHLPRYYFSITAIQAFVTFAVVGAAAIVVCRIYAVGGDREMWAAALALAGAACCTAQSALAIVGQTHKLQNRNLMGLLRYISSVDGLYGLLLSALALSLFVAGEDSAWTDSADWLLAACVTGGVPAIILLTLGLYRFSQQEYLLFLIGAVMFCAGFADVVHHSPLVSGFIFGAISANFDPHRLRALSTVVHAEKSIYVILLLLLGAHWYVRFDYILIWAGVYFLVRMSGKVAGAYVATRILTPKYGVPSHIGLGLISEGGLAVAIILDFKTVYGIPLADSLITIVVFSVVLSELMGPSLILSVFRNPDAEV